MPTITQEVPSHFPAPSTSGESGKKRREVEWTLSEPVRIGFLLAGVFLIYGNALLNGFTLDDGLYVAGNPQVTSFSLHGVFAPNAISNVFRPLTFTWLAVSWKIGRQHPFVFHLSNVVLHAAVTLLLYLLLRELLASLPAARPIALAAAWLFAAHPIHTEAVDSVMGLAELCAAGFLLAGWLLHLRGREAPALLCFCVALLSKESAAVFLGLVLLGDYLRGAWKPWTRYARMAALSLLYLAALWEVQGHRFGQRAIGLLDNPLAPLPAGWRILDALRVAWKYVALQLFPRTLSCDYSFSAIPVYLNWRHTLPAAIAAAFAAGLWFWTLRARKLGWALAIGIYVIAFATTANVLIPIGTIMGERLAYLPSAGFCLLIALCWGWFYRRHEDAACLALIGIVAVLGVRTVVRNNDWRDNLAILSSAVRAVPGSAKAHSNFGKVYLDLGLLPIAHQEFQTALGIYPHYPDALAFEGVVQLRTGHYAEARQRMQQALDLSGRDNPNYDYMVVNLAGAYMQLGQWDKALDILNRETAEAPNYARAWSNRAALRYHAGDATAARADAETALRLDHDNGQAQAVLRRLNGIAPSTGAR